LDSRHGLEASSAGVSIIEGTREEGVGDRDLMGVRGLCGAPLPLVSGASCFTKGVLSSEATSSLSRMVLSYLIMIVDLRVVVFAATSTRDQIHTEKGEQTAGHEFYRLIGSGRLEVSVQNG
jgi:hypothetical protein